MAEKAEKAEKMSIKSESESRTEFSVVPTWRRNPITAKRPIGTDSDILHHMDNHCAERYDSGKNVRLCDLAGEAGFESVTQMINHARRRGGKVMEGISRGMLVVAAGYEDLAARGNKTALHMLSLIPQFDSFDPPNQTPQRPFLVQKDINIQVSGVSRKESLGSQLTEQEAYMRLIKHKTYEEIRADVIDTEQTDEGQFRAINFEEGSDD